MENGTQTARTIETAEQNGDESFTKGEIRNAWFAWQRIESANSFPTVAWMTAWYKGWDEANLTDDWLFEYDMFTR